MSQPQADRHSRPDPPFMAASRAQFDAARDVAEHLIEAGYTWAEIENLSHLLTNIARTERTAIGHPPGGPIR